MNEKKIIEAILFLSPKPISLKRLKKIFPQAKQIITQLQQEYSDRGITIVEKEQTYQMVTAPEVSQFVKTFFKKDFDEPLSQASLEVLSIICYLGPITRAEIEKLRGVNSAYILRTLLIRGLIERKIHPQKNNVFVYQPSLELLKYLGVQKAEELPGYEELRQQFYG